MKTATSEMESPVYPPWDIHSLLEVQLLLPCRAHLGKHTLDAGVWQWGLDVTVGAAPSPKPHLPTGAHGRQWAAAPDSLSQASPASVRIPSLLFPIVQGSLKFTGNSVSRIFPKNQWYPLKLLWAAHGCQWVSAQLSSACPKQTRDIRHNYLLLLVFWKLGVQSLDKFSCQL